MNAFANCKKLECGTVRVKDEHIKEIVISRGIPSSVFNEYCPQKVLSCPLNQMLRFRGNTILIGIFLLITSFE